MSARLLLPIALFLVDPSPSAAQERPACTPETLAHRPGMDHAAHSALRQACADSARQALPKESGQALFAALTEVIRLLDADPATDWSRVNIEALRRHLLDMDAVMTRSEIQVTPIDGGFSARVTGSGATVASIQRMLRNHGQMMEQGGEVHVTTRSLPNGASVRVVSARPNDAAHVARLRALGVAGFLTEGDHHAPHHLAIARGDSSMRHHD